MRTRTAQVLYGYWNDVRAGRLAPRRFEIEPSRITELLPDTFILERADSADLRYRLAGTRLCELFGAEFRGTSFFAGWSSDEMASLCETTDKVLHDGAVGVLTVEAEGALGGRATFETLLLPLTHTRDSIDRILGAMASLGGERLQPDDPLVRRRLTGREIIWPEGRPHVLAERSHHQTPFATHVRNARIVRSDRRQFRVYDGGLAHEDPK